MNPFKNHAVQVKLVKTDETINPTHADESVAVDPQQIAEIATEFTVKTIGAIGVVIAGHKVLSTICDIAVIAAKAKFK